MKRTIKTPSGPRLIPDWAQCYCVKQHRPKYIYPYPFALPSGDELWLCPNTYHQVTTLLGMYTTLDGPPKPSALMEFNYFPRNLIKMYWEQVMHAREDEASFEAWKESLKPKDEDELVEEVKRMAVDE